MTPESQLGRTPAPDVVPTTPHQLTAVLRDAGTLGRGAVSTSTITEQIKTTVSNLWFLTVTCSSDSSPGLPNRILVKWPLKNSSPAQRLLEEPTFYRELGPALGSPPIVRCLATASATSEQQWIILEDLRDTHINPPWPERPHDEALEAAVSVLADLHAKWWEGPTLGASVGSWHSEASLRKMVDGIAGHLPGFIGALGAGLPAADRMVLEAVFSSSLAPWLRLLDHRALTVAHGDAHTLNFLFPRSGTGLPYLIDWQTWHLDVGARDLAYMIALHWDPAARKELELPLLRIYHQRLVSKGITGYPFEDLWLDYRRCVVRNLTFPIILWARGLPVNAWRHRLDCALAAYRSLGGDQFL